MRGRAVGKHAFSPFPLPCAGLRSPARRFRLPSALEYRTLYERVQSTALLIAKRDGQREDYNREKLTNTHRLEGGRVLC